ncbi:hypothetical protein [Geodermatophilus sp. SYSU D01176]
MSYGWRVKSRARDWRRQRAQLIQHLSSQVAVGAHPLDEDGDGGPEVGQQGSETLVDEFGDDCS